jgi:serine/threonine-protein kinase
LWKHLIILADRTERDHLSSHDLLDMTDLPPSFREDYKPVRELGEGSYGVVHLAEERETGKKRAIKVLKPGPGIEEARRDFEKEISFMDSYYSPYIVNVIDHESTEDPIGVVMEYLPEGDLSSLEESMGEREVLVVAKDVGRGLKEVHTRESKIVHRDVKPSNIMVELDEHNCRRYKLTDFGIAYLVRPNQGSGPFTRREKGTAGYMAIEQFEGKPNTASDIFSLGVVIYQLLTDRLPFEFDQDAGMSSYRDAIEQTERPEGVNHHGADVDPWLDDLLLKCLDRDADERPSAEDFLDTIDDNIEPYVKPYEDEGRRHRENKEYSKARKAWSKAYQLRPNRDLHEKLAKLPPANRGGKAKAPLRDDNTSDRERQLPREETPPPPEPKEVSESPRKGQSTKMLVAVTLVVAALLCGAYLFSSWGRTEPIELNGDDRFAFSSGSAWLATTGSSGNKVRLWKTTSPSWTSMFSSWNGSPLQVAHTLQGASGEAPDDMAFNGEQHLALLYLAQGKIARWSTGKNATRKRYALPEHARAGALAPGGELAAISTPQGIVLQDVQNGRRLDMLPNSSFDPGQLLFSPDGRYLAASEYMNHGIVVWNVQDRSIQHRFDEREGSASVPQIVFSPDGSMLSASGPSAVRAWGLSTGKRLMVLTPETGHESAPAVAFAPQRLLATVWPDGAVEVHDIERNRQVAAFRHSADTVTTNTSDVPAAAFSPDGAVLATALSSTGVSLWDPTGGEKLRDLRISERNIHSLAFSPKGQLLVAPTDSSLVTWRLGDPS